MGLLRPRERILRHTRTGWLAMCVATCVMVAGLPFVCQAANEMPSNSEITQAVETALFVEPGVSSHLIDVTASRGVVTLFGTVSNLLERDRAVAVTETVKGVQSIINRLEIRAVDRSDAEIRTDVERALLLDPAADSYDIDVKVQDSVVTLRGTVESWAEKLLVANVAKGVKGITEIRNAVTYTYDSDRPDFEIKADIEGRLRTDPYVDEGMIDVEVQDGVVTFNGVVGSLAEKEYATDKAYVAGITRVIDDDLTVHSWAKGPMERTTKVGVVTDDEAKEAAKAALLYDPRVASYAIDVEVENGRATLTGTVDNLKAKRAAGSDARNTTGIWSVNNWIKVRPKDTMADGEIAENIRDALVWDPIVERYEISVLVRNRQAWLMGVVDTRFEKRHAEDVASRVKGVAAVENKLVVEQPWTYKSDTDIKEDIESEYAWSPFVDGGDLEVRVNDGKAEIVGRVDTWHEYREAVENAFEGGAKMVHSTMHVQANDRTYDRSWSEAPSEVWPL